MFSEDVTFSREIGLDGIELVLCEALLEEEGLKINSWEMLGNKKYENIKHRKLKERKKGENILEGNSNGSKVIETWELIRGSQLEESRPSPAGLASFVFAFFLRLLLSDCFLQFISLKVDGRWSTCKTAVKIFSDCSCFRRNLCSHRWNPYIHQPSDGYPPPSCHSLCITKGIWNSLPASEATQAYWVDCSVFVAGLLFVFPIILLFMRIRASFKHLHLHASFAFWTSSELFIDQFFLDL